MSFKIFYLYSLSLPDLTFSREFIKNDFYITVQDSDKIHIHIALSKHQKLH